MAHTGSEPTPEQTSEDPGPPSRNDVGNPFYVVSLPEHVAEVRAIGEEVIRWVERADLKATILIGGAGAVFGGELIFYPDTVQAATDRHGAAVLSPVLLILSMVV